MTNRVIVIEGLDASWGGDPRNKARLLIEQCAGDGDTVQLTIEVDGHEDEPAHSAALLLHLPAAHQASEAINDQAGATQNVSTITGLGNDGQTLSLMVVRPNNTGMPTWLRVTAHDTEGAPIRMGLAFDDAHVADLSAALRSAVRVARAALKDAEWIISAADCDHAVPVTSGWAQIRVSNLRSRQVGMTIRVMTTEDTTAALTAWLRFADVERLLAKLDPAASATDAVAAP